MAKRQTRKSISFNRSVYDATKRVADQLGKSMAHFVEDALRAAGVDLPPTTRTTASTANVPHTSQKPAAPSKTRPPKSPQPANAPFTKGQRLDPGAASQRSAYFASIRAQERAEARTAKRSQKTTPSEAQPTPLREEPAPLPKPSINQLTGPRREGPIRRALGDAVADWAKEP